MMHANEPGSSAQGDLEVVRTLKVEATRRPWRRWLLWIGAACFLAALVWGVSSFRDQRALAEKPRFESAVVQRRDIQVIIAATGTLRGRNTVEVGAEVSGRVTKVLVDFNDHVKTGQVLARVDSQQLRASVEEAEAQAAAARAAIAQARATLLENEQSAARAAQEAKRGTIATRELEAAVAAEARARAALASSTANATVADATLKSTRARLDKSQIVSPIDGVVLARMVEPGQTLTAGYTTPVLFKLTEDLKQMTLSVYIDEADIGRAHEGQVGYFVVDAHPSRQFPSRVIALHNDPKESENVVSYEAMLRVDNDELLLRPGMTASATIVADQRTNVLAVPNAALRFMPPNQSADSVRHEPGKGVVWVLDGETPKPRRVVAGASDGEFSELLGGELTEGERVLTDTTESSHDHS